MHKKISQKEERELIDSIENEEWVSIKNQAARIVQIKDAAKKMLKKDAHLNIRIPSFDVDSLKSIAAKEGIPYQTLASQVLHKFVTGQILLRPGNITMKQRGRRNRKKSIMRRDS